MPVTVMAFGLNAPPHTNPGRSVICNQHFISVESPRSAETQEGEANVRARPFFPLDDLLPSETR